MPTSRTRAEVWLRSWTGVFWHVCQKMTLTCSTSRKSKIGWLVTSWLPGPWSVQLQFGSSAGILSPCQWHLTSEEYWDSSSEAGPATRAAAPFDEPRPELEVLAVDNGKLVFHGLQW